MRHRRVGFTILELLAVLTIIVLLMTLLIGASWRFVVQARQTGTAATLEKVGSIIDDRLAALRRTDFSDIPFPYLRSLSLYLNGDNGAGGPISLIEPELAEIFIRKMRYKIAFPQAFVEMEPGVQARLFPGITLPLPAPYDQKYENGIILYAVLMRGETFGTVSVAEDAFSAAELRVGPETGGLPCLVDQWGEPLRFYRWPTRLIKCGEQTGKDYNLNGVADGPGSISTVDSILQASPAIRPTGSLMEATPASIHFTGLPAFDINSPYSLGPDQAPGFAHGNGYERQLGWVDSDDPEPLNRDPDDPTMRLIILLQRYPNARQFVIGSTMNAGLTYYVDAFHDPFTFWAPLVVSAGPDKQLGLGEPTDVPVLLKRFSFNYGYLAAPNYLTSSIDAMYDNITNRNQRPGGR